MDPMYLGPPDPEEIEGFIKKLAREIVKRHMAAPAIVLLESMKPLSFVGSQAMIFFDPMVQMLGGAKNYVLFQKVLEDRELLEKLITAIEREDDNPTRG